MTARVAPSLPGHFLLGHLPERKRDALGLFSRGAELGPIVRYRMGFFDSYLLTDPAFIKHVLQDNSSNYGKGPIFEKMEVLIGKGLITSEGEHWRKQRRLVQPVFQRQRLPAQVPLIHEALDERFGAWAKRDLREPFDLHAEMTILTMNVICSTLFGPDALPRMAEIAGAGLGFIDEVSREVLTLFSPLAMLLRKKPKKGPAILGLQRILREIIVARKARSEEGDDFLSQLLRSKDDRGVGMNDEELLDEVLTLFVAGHETTALSLTWALYLLGSHATEQERLRGEIQTVLRGERPSQADLARLPFLHDVALETMRLFPPVWSFPRQAKGDDVIDGVPIPKGSFTVQSAYVMQRHPRYWNEPEKFIPDRFRDGEGKDPFIYFPFGAGVRRCAGYYFAMLETELLLARIIERFRVEVMPGSTVVPLPLATLKPDRPILARLSLSAPTS